MAKKGGLETQLLHEVLLQLTDLKAKVVLKPESEWDTVDAARAVDVVGKVRAESRAMPPEASQPRLSMSTIVPKRLSNVPMRLSQVRADWLSKGPIKIGSGKNATGGKDKLAMIPSEGDNASELRSDRF